MSILRNSRSFKDLSLSFSPHPVTKDLPVLANERAILRSVRNLVETMPTERFFNSLIGTEVRSSLFQNYTRGTLVTIEDQIVETIENYEPRVDLIKVKVTPDYGGNALNVTIVYFVTGIDSPPQQLDFVLLPTR